MASLRAASPSLKCWSLSLLAVAVLAGLAGCKSKAVYEPASEAAAPPPPSEPSPVDVAGQEESLDAVTVTGSRIQQLGITSAAPTLQLQREGSGQVLVSPDSVSGETYAATSDSPPKRAAEHPLSTFSIDVTSYCRQSSSKISLSNQSSESMTTDW